MTLLALGVDVSTRQTAMVVLDEDGYHQKLTISYDLGEQGARRLMSVRQAVGGALDCTRWELNVAAVEVPLNRQRSFALESVAAVVMEVIQARYPHLIVLDPVPVAWQAHTIGCGWDAKTRSLEHAKGLGLDTDDDDLADAACIADYARELYIRDVRSVA